MPRPSMRPRRRRDGHRAPLAWYGSLLLVLLAVLGPSAPAQPPALPQPVGYVNDFANVIAPDAEERIRLLAERLNAATRGDLVVVTLPDLAGRPVEETSLRLGREWKIGADAAIGDQARNAGVVILIVPKETAADGRGRCRIEVGQGAEGFLTDATAGALCREQTDRFRAQDYSGAVEALTFAVADRYAASFNVTLDGQPRPQRRPSSRNDGGGFPVMLFIIIALFVLSSFGGRRRRGCVGCIPLPIPGGPVIYTGGSSGWGGGGFGGGGGGGFGGFGGGGGFSGGGGGSDW